MSQKEIYICDRKEVRLDRYLKSIHPSMPQGFIEKSLRAGKILVNDQKSSASFRVTFHDVITIEGPLPDFNQVKKKSALQKEIILTQKDKELIESMRLWEDDKLFVVNKPFGIAVQGGTKTDYHLDGLLKAYGQQTGCVYRLVHRLDRDTSGVLVLAKTADAAQSLTNAFKYHDVLKIYWAVVVGVPPLAHGVIDAPLAKESDGFQERVATNPKQGKPASTFYRLLKRLPNGLSVVEFRPETGRTHQIRVHAAHMGTPILGDGKYGGKMATAKTKELHLHARSLRIPDPDTGNPLTFQAEFPEHIRKTLGKWADEIQ